MDNDIGTVAASIMVLLNEASVLYTFYAPLQAHWIFYVGLALVVVGSWIGGAIAQIMKYVEWRKANPGQPSPLLNIYGNCQFGNVDYLFFRCCS